MRKSWFLHLIFLYLDKMGKNPRTPKKREKNKVHQFFLFISVELLCISKPNAIIKSFTILKMKRIYLMALCIVSEWVSEWVFVFFFCFVSCIVDPIFILLIHMFATCVANWISTHFIFFHLTYRHKRLMCVCVLVCRVGSSAIESTCPLKSSTEWSFECAHYPLFTLPLYAIFERHLHISSSNRFNLSNT